MNSIVSNIREGLTNEICVILLVACFPLVYLFFKSGDVVEYEQHLKGFIVQGFMLKYTFWLTGIYGVLTLIRHYYRNRTWVLLDRIFSQLASDIINVYRLAAGAMIAIPIVWHLAEPETMKLNNISFFCLYGVLFIGFCVLGSATHIWIEEKFNKAVKLTATM